MSNLTPMPVAEPEARTMDFPDALRQLMIGKKIARVSWGNADYGFLLNDWLTIFHNGKEHTWLVSQGDLEGQDWVIFEEQNQ